TVSAQPTITQQPQAQHVSAGATATFTVGASGAGTLAYQWQKDGANLSNGGNISGAQAAQLQVSGASEADQGNYRCVVTDDCGSVIPDPAALTISYDVELFRDNFNTSACERWSIYYDDWTDAGCTVYHDNTSQDACGSPSGFAYRQYAGNRWMVRENFTTAGYENLVLAFWYKNDSGTSIEAWAKQNGTWTQVANVGAAGSWTQHQVGLSGTVTGLRFRFVASTNTTRRLDCVSIKGEPACTPPVVITQQPGSLAVCPGGTATFSVTATGSSLTYQWQKNGANLVDGGDISGATTPVLEIANAEPGDAGNYGCVVTGDCGTKISIAAQLVVSAAPTILQQPQATEECQGNTATFSISVLGAGTVHYQWQKDSANLTNGGDISGANSPTLQIANVEMADEGLYRCIVTDDCGTTTSASVALMVVESCLGASPSGHYVTYRGQTLMLIGDSGTQCATQNVNLDYRQWIDDCAARGIRMVHVWSFMSPRQKQDGSVVESRYGYVYPGVTPWARHTSGALANDQLYRWNLRAFDDGPDGATNHYWPRMRDMVAYAKSKDVVVGYTMFTGWIKGNHDAWAYHPFNVANGGHLSTNLPDGVTIASPGTEVWQEAWSDGWSNAKKTQWIWEQLSVKAINDLAPFGNVFFVFFDEHSYEEGNMGDHFRDFFRNRGQIWTDWNSRRSTIDLVMSPTESSTDKNSLARGGFGGSPVRPYLFLEGEPYLGDPVRTAIWTFSIGGGHYTFHADAGQETERTGIMGYDPNVPGGDKGMYKRDWMGHASRLFNQYVANLDTMAPHNELCDSGTYCLADPGREYVVYSKIGSSTNFNVNLFVGDGGGKIFDCRFYNPRNGNFQTTFQRAGGNIEPFTKPSSDDWVIH
ncbi:MAG TPA: immunoglobulin domain-containing protein, partial [Candidatus Hydrogenedentes bacterium]|nr:immunoglobulin domain-containing protein [Candidatus Hydrogenedentota bacterium]